MSAEWATRCTTTKRTSWGSAVMTAAITAFPNPFLGYETQFDDYVNEASFLWLLRARALSQPHFHPGDLAELESRIDGQFLALMQSPEQAWKTCENVLQSGGAGEVFVAAVVAFRSREVSRIQRVIEVGLSSEAGYAALASALTWLPGRYCHDWVRKFLTSKDMVHKRLALTVCMARNEDPCDYLTRILRRDDCRADLALHAEALRCAGVFKRRDLSPFLAEGREMGEPAITFQACRSAVLLGDRAAARALADQALQPGPEQRAALTLGVRALPGAEARQWIGQALQPKTPEATRLSLIAAATLGDPEVVPWLLSCMKQPATARLAGEAFFQITGIDLEEHELSYQMPTLEGADQEDDPDTPLPAMDEDEHLPWPNSEKLAALWETIKPRFTSGQRYLLGRPLSEEHLRRVFLEGPQRQRVSAALEWALLDPRQPWLSVERRQEVG